MRDRSLAMGDECLRPAMPYLDAHRVPDSPGSRASSCSGRESRVETVTYDARRGNGPLRGDVNGASVDQSETLECPVMGRSVPNWFGLSPIRSTTHTAPGSQPPEERQRCFALRTASRTALGVASTEIGALANGVG